MKTESHQSPLGNEGATQALSTKRAIGRGPFALRRNHGRFAATALLGLVMLASACTPEPETTATGSGEGPIKVTNRIDVPEVVRNNLGITFAKVERRKIAQTLRVPGRFETPPDATRVYSAALPGCVELQVRQNAEVADGAWLFRIHSPRLREMETELESSEAARIVAVKTCEEIFAEKEFLEKEVDRIAARERALQEARAAAAQRIEALEASNTLWGERVAALEELMKSGAGKAADVADARARMLEAAGQLAECRQALAEYALRGAEFKTELARVELGLAQAAARNKAAGQTVGFETERFNNLLLALSTVTGFTFEQLLKEEHNVPLWRRLGAIEVEAAGAGVVLDTHVSNGAWVEQGAPILTVVDPQRVRVRARSLQADLMRVMSGQAARILPPVGGALALEMPMQGKLAIGLTADADERVVDVFVTPESVLRWARPGVAVQVEITIASSDASVLAIPNSCVVSDELQRIFFRRDPNDPNKVIRINGEFGISDGRWIEVKRDVIEGDEVVLGGVYELKLTGSGKTTGAGHFHADGTFHEGKH